MDEYFYIAGARIAVSAIKDFQIVQREYIYRPTYVEADKTFGNSLRGIRFKFYKMQPYAAIIGESDKKSAISQYNPKSFKESAGKDILEDVRTTLGDKFNIKALRSKKYHCINQTGRMFTTYLEDVPALVMRSDGKASDIRKNDELYPQLGEPIAPAINIVHALEIKADQKYVFYGNGIQIEDLMVEFERLRLAVDTYNAEKKEKTIGARIKASIGKIGKRGDSVKLLPSETGSEDV